MNAYLNLVKAFLAPDVKKPDSVFLDLDKFLDFDDFRTVVSTSSLISLSTSLPSFSLSSIFLSSSLLPPRPALLSPPTPTPPFLGSAVFSIEVSSAAIRLNL